MKRILLAVLAATGILLGVAASPSSAASCGTGLCVVHGTGSTLRAQFNEAYDGSGYWYFIYGTTVCTVSTSTYDYAESSMAAGWDNRISALYDYNQCDVNTYDLTGFAGASTGYHNYGTSGSYIEVPFPGWNDRMSSFKIS